MYHRFGENGYPSTNIRLEQFDAQLHYLAENQFAVMPLAEILKGLQGSRPLPDRAVAITIDDAYRSVYEHAFPRLKHYGWPFTVFVNTEAIDHNWPSQMTWEQMRTMQPHGVTFANHSARHLHLLQKAPDESDHDYTHRIRTEVETAQQRLNDQLQPCPLWFSYPYGEYNTRVADVVRGLGYVCFGIQSGAIGPHSDWRALPRFPINEHYGSQKDFAEKVQSLPLPVASYRPWDPATSDRRPVLDVVLALQGPAIEQVRCFVSGQGQVEVQWLEEGRRLQIQAPHDLPQGSARYNLTAPSAQPGRFYWFSKQWIVD